MALDGRADTQPSSRSDCKRARSTSTLATIRWQNKRLEAEWQSRSSPTKSQPEKVHKVYAFFLHNFLTLILLQLFPLQTQFPFEKVDYSALQQVHADQLIQRAHHSLCHINAIPLTSYSHNKTKSKAPSNRTTMSE